MMMKNRLMRLLSLALAMLLTVGGVCACGESDPSGEASGTLPGTTSGDVTEAATADPADAALEELAAEVDWNGEEFGVLYDEGFANEVYGESGRVSAEGNTAQVINDALYERNALFAEKCGLSLSLIAKPQSAADVMLRNEATAPTGDFRIFHYKLHLTPNLAINGYCANFLDMDVDVDASWWDAGTADFCLDDNIFFMCGDANTADDDVTYALFFNKQLAETYKTGNLYDRVRAWEWTLDAFNQLIQNVSSDSNGDGKWDENDTYGFATNMAYGNTFFIGSDLRYIINDRTTDSPELYLDTHMDRAEDVLTLSRQIYHANNVSYIAPSGKEPNSHAIFIGNRSLFFGEIAANLTYLNANMETDFGVLPVPKYDKTQEHYRTWTHGLGSCVAVTSALGNDEWEKVGDTLEIYAILAHQKLKPAYYDVLLSSRSVRDADSAEMLDLIFSNRVYDLAMYFNDNFGFWNLFENCVNGDTDTFSSSYASKARSFDRKVNNLLTQMKGGKKK